MYYYYFRWTVALPFHECALGVSGERFVDFFSLEFLSFCELAVAVVTDKVKFGKSVIVDHLKKTAIKKDIDRSLIMQREYYRSMRPNVSFVSVPVSIDLNLTYNFSQAYCATTGREFLCVSNQQLQASNEVQNYNSYYFETHTYLYMYVQYILLKRSAF